MKSKRAAAAFEDVKPVDVAQDLPAKKRKRGDDDAEPDNEVRKSKKDKKDKEDKKDKKKDKEDKKAKKDKSKYNNKTRKEKKEERKDIQALPEDMDVDDDEVAKTVKKSESKTESKTNGKAETKKDDKDSKKETKEKKEKKEKSSKKDSKKEKSPSKDAEDAIDLDLSSAQKQGRNIVFVGNLPYSATAASITAHFATLKPIAVRCLTKKEDPKVCRGIAFVEFATPTHQRTCLDKFHHSMFEDGVSAARKINVELTAGGGGKGQGRQDKIMEKNKKLDENRAKRIEKEKTAKEENQTNGKSNARMDIHPSRLARLPGFGSSF